MSRFTFNANALGVGGYFVDARGNRTAVPSLASVALSPGGGEGFAAVENYSNHGIAFTRAESRVAGYPISSDEKTFATWCDIFITNLSVRDRLRVALMQLTVTSTRHLDRPHSSFEVRAMYRGVQYDEQDLAPAVDVDFCNAATYEDYARQLGVDLPSADESPSNEQLLAANNTEIGRALLFRREAIRTSIVTNVHSAASLTVEDTNKVTLPGLGTARFGEMLVKPGRRRVNLLTIEFGANGENEGPGGGGSLTMGSGDGNGVPVWPPP